MKLTDFAIRSLKAPAAGAAVVYDDQLAGFGVRVSVGGTKSFILVHGPRRTRETLGRVGIVSLHEARVEAKRRLAEYTLGRDKPRAVAWDVAVEEYLAVKAEDLKPRTLADYTYILNRHFKYGATKLHELSPHDIHKSLDRLGHTPGEQVHAFVIVRAFIRWTYRRHYLGRNPMERMQAPGEYVTRDRILTNDELVLVWNAAGEGTYGRIVKTLILTGQRRGEITQLRGKMVGESMVTLPASLVKNSRQHVFPLGDMAREVLGPPVPANAFYFPALGKTTAFNGHSPSKRLLDARCGVTDWRIHDLRRTFASGLASIGVQLPVIERLLNHVSGSFGGIVGVYQRYDFMPEMREAISKWEAHIQGLLQAAGDRTDSP